MSAQTTAAATTAATSLATTAATSSATARTLSLPLRSPLPKTAPKKTGALRLVPQRRSSAAKAPFAIVLVTLLVGGLLGLLLLNTLVAQGSFRLHDLASRSKVLQQQQQDLLRQVQALQAPSALASQAMALGMVPGNAPAFLRLSDGKVLGVPTAGGASASASVGASSTAPVTGPPTAPKVAPTSSAHAPTTPTRSARTALPPSTPTGAHQ